MDANRRDFLKKAGVSIVGIGVGAPAVSALADVLGDTPYPGAVEGKRWAMIIDTRKCNERKDCNACTEACHQVHNVPSALSAAV